MVATLDRSERPEDAYRGLWRKWQSLRQWMERRWGGRIEYVGIVERHKDGWPHINLCLHSPAMLAECERIGWRAQRRAVNDAAIRSGWGLRLHWERARDVEAVAGYYVKLTHESAKLTQAPTNAPPNFRRLRASRGLLPPAFTSDRFTGELVRCAPEFCGELLSRLAQDRPERVKRIALDMEFRREIREAHKHAAPVPWYAVPLTLNERISEREFLPPVFS